MTITDVAPKIRSGELTPSALLEQCLLRVDQYEPAVKAWAFLDRERARREAERFTDEVKRGQYRGPLHGIPVGIKDIIDVFDMPTGCGSKLWANSFARRDATCVERLRQAGAVILGKTVTTPYAFFDPPPTRNPWNLERTPGGSSSGSAAAVACGMVLAALGTQTGGSVTRPASYCGVCSLKPTFGRISVDGVLPFAPSLDHVGVMANCVRDLAIVFQTMARNDLKSVPHPYHFTTEMDKKPSSVFRQLGELPDFPHHRAEPVMQTAFAEFQNRTRQADWAWTTLPLPPSLADVPRHYYTLVTVEAAHYHAERMMRHPDDYPPKIRHLIEDGLRAKATDLESARRHHQAYQREIESVFVDSWRTAVTPATLGPAPTPETTGDPAFNSPWSYSGLPTVSVPIGTSPDGLPLAVQLISQQWCEDELFRTAALLEADLNRPRPLPPL